MTERSLDKLRALIFAAIIVAPGCWHARGAELASGNSTERASHAEALIAQADSFGARGDYLRAEQYLNAALAQGADETRLLPLVVRICIADQRYRDAAQYLENHLRRHPTDRAAGFLLASVHFSLGHVELARKELAALVAADPSRADAHYALAVLLRDEAGDLADANRHFREYLRLNPKGAHAEEARGSLLVALP
jgi:tetratricopeptide (TPR) repeat protein